MNLAEQVQALKVAGLARLQRRRLPRQLPPRSIERAYAQELLDLVALVERELEPLMRELPELMRRAQAEREGMADLKALGVRLDSGEGRRAMRLAEQAQERIRAALDTESAERLAQRVAGRTAQFQREQIGRQIQAVLGVDVLLTDRGLAALVDGFVAENVALIRSIPEEVVSKVERAVTRGVQAGTLTRDLTREIEDIVDGGRQRARLIARDQVGKFYGQVNEARQKEMGAEEYIWRTVRDARVRDEHEARDGQRFRWDSPPEDGHPGEPIQCRCYAEPVFDGLL